MILYLTMWTLGVWWKNEDWNKRKCHDSAHRQNKSWMATRMEMISKFQIPATTNGQLMTADWKCNDPCRARIAIIFWGTYIYLIHICIYIYIYLKLVYIHIYTEVCNGYLYYNYIYIYVYRVSRIVQLQTQPWAIHQTSSWSMLLTWWLHGDW